MTGLDVVAAWPLDRLGAAAALLDGGAEELWATGQRLTADVDRDPYWVGATHDAAGRRTAAEVAVLHRTARTLAQSAEIVSTAASGLLALRTALLTLVESSRKAGFEVDDDGTVRHSNPSRCSDADYLSERIVRQLRMLIDLDRSLGQQLQLLAELHDRTGRVLPAPAGGTLTPQSSVAALEAMSPAGRRQYWDALSAAEREQLIQADPLVIGNLDGVAFADRIAANHINVRQALAARLAAGEGQSPRVRALRELLEPARGPDGRLVPRTLIAFEDVGNGRVIELVGELTEESTGVGLLVPGTGTRLETLDRQRDRALALSRAAGAPVFVYLDGDLPQRVAPTQWSDLGTFLAGSVSGPVASLSTMDELLDGTAVERGPARQLGTSLVDFARQVDVEIAEQAPGAPLTVIGHSYGGSVVGTAEQLGLRADNIVYASSAGTGVLDDGWHNANPAVQRYSLTPPGDPIQLVQMIAAAHGGDPDIAPGVIRLDSGFYAAPDGGPGELVAGSGAHSGYLDDYESTGFRNLAAVLSGEPTMPYIRRAPDLPEQAVDLIQDLARLGRTFRVAGTVATGVAGIGRLLEAFAPG